MFRRPTTFILRNPSRMNRLYTLKTPLHRPRVHPHPPTAAYQMTSMASSSSSSMTFLGLACLTSEYSKYSNHFLNGPTTTSIDTLMTDARSWLSSISRECRRMSRDPTERLISGIILTNVVVYTMWTLAGFRKWSNLQRVMETHFTSSLAGVWTHGRAHTLVTSMFSHKGLLHLGMNMYVLKGFGPALIKPETRSSNHEGYRNHYSTTNFVERLKSSALVQRYFVAAPKFTQEEFLGFYLTSGVVANVMSVVEQHVRRRPLSTLCVDSLKDREISLSLSGTLTPRSYLVMSLGASGAIMGIFSLFCLKHPNAQVRESLGYI